MIEIVKYARKPFEVDAVQVTAENMTEVASWCGGDVQTSNGNNFVKVSVERFLSERQTMAFSGDWILKAGTGYKVYTPKAFKNSFEPLKAQPVIAVG